MSDFKKVFKEQYLKELNSPNDKTSIKEKIGIEAEEKPIKKAFLRNLKKKPIIMLSTCILIIAIIIVTSVVVVNYRNTPVYQGMEAQSLNSRQNVNSRMNRAIKRDDHTDIEKVITEEIGVVVEEGISYYATKNEIIEVTVKINNPKFFEILSFTLNGRLYQSYEFREGSNSEQIKVAFTCNDTSGIEVITIDAIKYVDDTTIKNARFEADRTISIGVLYEDTPNITSLSEVVLTTSFGLSFVVNDVNNLIDLTNGLMIYLFDGTKIINTTKLVLGMNVIPYSNLHMGSTYEYAIVGVFDPLDGKGKRASVLHSNEITTDEGIMVESVIAGYDSLTIDYSKIDTENADIVKIDLYEGDNLINSLTELTTDYSFNNLKSNTTYVIKTTYDYKITENNQEITIEKEIEYEFTTLTRPVPTIDIIEVVPYQEEVSFNYDITDTTDVGSIVEVTIYKGEELIETKEEKVTSFNNLLSDTEYLIKVTYRYDLLDGTGYKTITNQTTFKTLAKTAPEVTIIDVTKTQTEISFNKQITDIDEICVITSYELWQNGVIVKTLDNDITLSFTDLL